MLHALDHTGAIYTGDPLLTTPDVFEHYGRKLDDAVRSGIKVLYSDALNSLHQARETMLGVSATDLWCPIEDWKVD